MKVSVLSAVLCFLFAFNSKAQTLQAWYDIADASTITYNGSNVVSELRDKSGNGRHLTGTGSSTYVAPNGSPAHINFPDYSSMLSRTGLAISQPFTVYLVIKQNNFDDNAFLVRFGSDAGIKHSEYISSSGAGTIDALVPHAGASLNNNRNKIPNYYRTTWSLFKFVFDGDASYTTLNGGARLLSVLFPKPSGPGPSTFEYAVGSNNLNQITLGSGIAGDYANFDFAELRIYTSITDAQAATIEQSLLTKFGLSPVVGIKAFGDSNTRGAAEDADNFKENWVYYAGTEKNKPFYNYAVNTTVVFDKDGNTPDYNTYGFHTTRTLGQYGTSDYCFFLYGTNDVAYFTIDETWKNGYKNRIKESFIDPPYNYDKAKLIICSPPYRVGYNGPNQIPKIRQYCQEIATELGIQFADLYTTMVNTGNPANYLNSDGYHLNKAGQRLAADLFKSFIDQGTLPVKFSLFNAACANNAVRLTWKTAQESNSKRFDIERSSDGRSWQVISSVNAAGNTTDERSYTFTDHTSSSDFLYRVAQVDAEGKKIYTATLRSSCSKSADEFSVFPNPIGDMTTVSITSVTEAQLILRLYDVKGVLLRVQRNQILSGVTQVQVNVSGLAKGAYTLSATWNNSSKSVQLVK